MLDIRTLLLRTADDRYEAPPGLRAAEAAVWPLLRARRPQPWKTPGAQEPLGIPA